MSTTKSLIVSAGSRGGVGKSLVAMCVTDWLTCGKSERVSVIDSDTSNPDVYKQHKHWDPKPRSMNLDTREGWMELGDECDKHSNAHVVINTGARNLDALLDYSGPILEAIAQELHRRVVMLWVINAQRDSVELLRSYMEAKQESTVLHVVRNEGEKEGRSFDFFERTETAKQIAESKGKTITIPTLAERVTQILYTHRQTIRAIADGSAEIVLGDKSKQPVPFGSRVEMCRWRNMVWIELEKLDLLQVQDDG